MTVAELMHGRGTVMSAREFSVEWPAYFRAKKREKEYEANRPGRGRKV